MHTLTYCKNVYSVWAGRQLPCLIFHALIVTVFNANDLFSTVRAPENMLGNDFLYLPLN